MRKAFAACTTVAVLLTLNCLDTQTLPPCLGTLPPAPKRADAVTLVAAGDIADCALEGHRLTAKLVEDIAPDLVLTLGDMVYPNGSLGEFLGCYDSAWGKFRSITRPAIGNHEYHTAHAGPYFSYFCGATGATDAGYYSFDYGPWHIVSLNSNCNHDLDIPTDVSLEFGGCGADSPQAKWLRNDLANAKGRTRCTLAMYHHPLHNIGPHENAETMRALWRVLVEGGADLALSAHAHDYERFAPENAEGAVDESQGLPEIVVGTGGAPLYAEITAKPNSVVRTKESYGVLELHLEKDRARYRYVPTSGNFRDEGEVLCHD
jgi:acid phosphatase type 7